MAKIGEAVGAAAAGATAGTAIAPGIGTIIGGVLGLGSSLLGGDEEASYQEKAYQEALQKMKDLHVPNPEDMAYQLTGYKPQEVGPAILEKEAVASKSAFESLPETDPRLVNAQMQALSRLQKVGAQGLTPQDLAAFQQAEMNVARAQKGQQDAILQSMAARGQGGAGAELAARLSTSQAAANRLAEMQQNQAAEANRARLAAIGGAGELASKYRTQQFGEQSTGASAKDIMERFNKELSTSQSSRNVNRLNQTEAQKLAEKQRAEASRVDTSNQMARRQGDIPGLTYDMQLRKLTPESNLLTEGAKASQDREDRNAAGRQQTWKGITDVATSAGKYINAEDEE